MAKFLSRISRMTLLRWLSVPLAFGVVLGIAVAGVGTATVERTNTIEFCVSCHEMKAQNYAEYSHTIHARNRTGVKAICSDCHVPHDALGTLVRKVGAAKDIWSHLTGRIDTPQKFEAHRLEMATAVWRRMKETDSRECRSCHDVSAMDPESQGPTARKQHQKLADGSHTCIDCHFGIAHKEPQGGVEPRDVVAAGSP